MRSEDTIKLPITVSNEMYIEDCKIQNSYMRPEHEDWQESDNDDLIPIPDLVTYDVFTTIQPELITRYYPTFSASTGRLDSVYIHYDGYQFVTNMELKDFEMTLDNYYHKKDEEEYECIYEESDEEKS